MKRQHKTERTIATCVENTKEFETYLIQQGHTLDKATVQDLESFSLEWLDRKRVSKFIWALSHYFEFIHDKDLLGAANQIRQGRIELSRFPLKLKDFRGVQSGQAEALATLGIEDTLKMLETGKTPKLRNGLAEKTGLDINVIEELVKLSDLARIQGLKGIRARLYHDAGYDSLEKLRKSRPEEVLRITREFVERTDFDGIPPAPKEVQNAIESAKKLPDIIEW